MKTPLGVFWPNAVEEPTHWSTWLASRAHDQQREMARNQKAGDDCTTCSVITSPACP